MTRTRTLNYIAFAALMISTAFGFQALWGLLFLFWTVSSLQSRHAFLLSDVKRGEDPVLFWLIQAAWVVLGLLMIAADFFPAWS